MICLPQTQLNRLQRIRNALVRVVFATSKSSNPDPNHILKIAALSQGTVTGQNVSSRLLYYYSAPVRELSTAIGLSVCESICPQAYRCDTGAESDVYKCLVYLARVMCGQFSVDVR